MRLSPGYGTVRKISSRRTNPYAVHPPTINGIRPKAICYVPDRETGIAVLKLYHAGQYTPGMEKLFEKEAVKAGAPTLAQIYEKYLAYRLSPACTRKGDKNSLNSAFSKLASFHHLTLDEITIDDWQGLLNNVAEEYSKTTVTRVKGLITALYNYALVREMSTKSYGLYVEMPKVKEEEHHPDFTDQDLEVLWENSDDPVVKMILVMCYTGFRIGAFESIETHLEGEIAFFKGGVKTEAGKNRIVPIHSSILEIVKEMNGVYLCGKSESQFRRDMEKKLIELGIDTTNKGVADTDDEKVVTAEKDNDDEKTDVKAGAVRHHTPHSCRHTFSRLCESYGVREADRKRLMGHSFGNDITNRVYGHRSLRELWIEVEKIGEAKMAA